MSDKVKAVPEPARKSGRKPDQIKTQTATTGEQFCSNAITAVGDVAYRWLIKDDVISWGEGASSLLGIVDMSPIASGRGFNARVVAQKGSSRYDAVTKKSAGEGASLSYAIEYQVRDDFGALRWIEDRGRWFCDADGKPEFAVGMLRGVDERRIREDRLVKLSTYDELTNLINRIRLKEGINETLTAAQQSKNAAAFLLIAIDNLAHINDSYGFDVADEVIVGIGKRLTKVALRLDSVGRYSGNKFGLILRNCARDRLANITERVLAAVRSEVIATSRGPVATTISAGAVSLPQHGTTVESALAHAEEALMAAKQLHRDSYVIYTPCAEREKIRQRNINVADELVAALNDRRVCLAYQPILSAKTGEVVFHECLLRLVQEDGEVRAAGNFVAIAEKLGLIGLLDYRAMELAIKALQDKPELRLALNVSGRTTSDHMWLESLVAQLRANSGLATRLTVEITETVALQDIEESIEFVTTLRDLGCKVAIDDFGAGYTSFRNLRSLQVDMVKIDGSFVQGIVDNEDNQFFVRTLVQLAHNLRIPIVAEWVSNTEEVTLLREMGIEYLQGFCLGEPSLSLPGSEAPALKRKRA